jgi:hypothetical protein
MRDEPQDTNGTIQVQYRVDTDTDKYNKRGRGHQQNKLGIAALVD